MFTLSQRFILPPLLLCLIWGHKADQTFFFFFQALKDLLRSSLPGKPPMSAELPLDAWAPVVLCWRSHISLVTTTSGCHFPKVEPPGKQDLITLQSPASSLACRDALTREMMCLCWKTVEVCQRWKWNEMREKMCLCSPSSWSKLNFFHLLPRPVESRAAGGFYCEATVTNNSIWLFSALDEGSCSVTAQLKSRKEKSGSSSFFLFFLLSFLQRKTWKVSRFKGDRHRH